jgi:alpha-glucosidase
MRVSAARDHRRGDSKLVSPLTLQRDRYPGPLRWWQSGSIYQIYPRSFQDSDGDGVGDLRGIGQRLDYLHWLGIDAIWLSPIFRSPMADFGYDVADYTDVDPMFGTLADLDALIEGAHQRRIRVLLDFVPNHTSDRHAWFLDARSSRSADHRDWYIWRDPLPGGGPPNDWQANFGGSAWEWDETTGQYYFHSFLKEQPDLDWTNHAVRQAMSDVLRFWFARGVDGFRIDVINLIAKKRELRPTRAGARQVWGDESRIQALVQGIRRVADEFGDRVLIGEIWLPPRKLVAYYGADLSGLHLPFNFQLLLLPWSAARIASAIRTYEGMLPTGAWPNWVLGNHDRPRMASRVGAAQARVAAMLLLTLRGTPTIYYGDEIGLGDVAVPPAEQRDPQGLRGGDSRDPQRTPMRWDSTLTAGFSGARPWLPVGPEVETINVEAQRGDPASMVSLYRRLLELRRSEPALHGGAWQEVSVAGSAMAYLRTDGDRRFAVALNLAGRVAELPPAATDFRGTVLVSTLGPTTAAVARFEARASLAPNEALLVLLD